MPLHIHTPLIESRPLSMLTGRNVYLKMDALQPVGSFKIRGIGHAAEIYSARGAKRFVASSGGNAGLAVAYAARKLGLPCLIIVPETTSVHSRELIELEGARVLIRGDSWREAHLFAQSVLEADDAYIHPFDDPLLWAGHATIIDEILADGVRPDVIVCAVGGGGLYCGIQAGLLRNNLTDTRIIAVETQGADSFAQALAIGQPVTLDKITSIAVSLGAKRVCDEALRWANLYPPQSVVVSDADAVHAAYSLLADHRVAVEAACGAALALGYSHANLLGTAKNVVIVVCGGVAALPALPGAMRSDRAPA